MPQQRAAKRTVITARPASMPPKPPAGSPKFQPKKSPEMTAPTPRAHKSSTRACRRNVLLAKYSWSGRLWRKSIIDVSVNRLKMALHAYLHLPVHIEPRGVEDGPPDF